MYVYELIICFDLLQRIKFSMRQTNKLVIVPSSFRQMYQG